MTNCKVVETCPHLGHRRSWSGFRPVIGGHPRPRGSLGPAQRSPEAQPPYRGPADNPAARTRVSATSRTLPSDIAVRHQQWPRPASPSQGIPRSVDAQSGSQPPQECMERPGRPNWIPRLPSQAGVTLCRDASMVTTYHGRGG